MNGPRLSRISKKVASDSTRSSAMRAGSKSVVAPGFPWKSVALPSTKALCRSNCSSLKVSPHPRMWLNMQTALSNSPGMRLSRSELARESSLVVAVITR